MATAVGGRFARSEMTWASYLLLGYFGYLQTVLGPVMPFLQRDLHLSYGIAGLHFSAFAAGMVAAGLVGNRASERWGRPLTFWGGAAGMALGACALALGRQVAVTVAGSGVMGLGGTLLLVTIQAVLAQEHGARRAQAVSEANVLASVGSSLAALCVGVSAGLGLGWRATPLVAVGVLALLALRFRKVALPARPPTRASGRSPAGPLPPLFWAYWSAMILGVAAEWCVAYWGAAYLHRADGIATGTAATLMGLYLGATVAGRVVGSRLVRAVDSARLWAVADGVALGGVLLFWRAPGGPLAVAGLCVAGLGIANLFPLALATGLSLAPAQPDAASARLSLGAGLAILSAPLAVGALADHVGIGAAYGVVPILLGGVGLLALGANGRLSRQRTAGRRGVPAARPVGDER